MRARFHRYKGIVRAERLCFVALAVLVALLCYTLVTTQGPIRVLEHSWLEVGHAMTLAVACAIFILARWFSDGANRTVATACAMLMATGVIRELDVQTWHGPAWWTWLTQHGLQEILLVGGGVVALVYLFVNREYFRGILSQALSWFSWPFHMGVAITFCGAYLLERKLKFLPNAQLIEEYVEFAGYILLVVAALRTLELSSAFRRR